jgi:biotin carboxyl carrier protein
VLTEISTTEKPKKIYRKANIQAGEVAAPMSGRVIRVLAQEDHLVNAGDVLLSVTAMKMVSFPVLSMRSVFAISSNIMY